MARALQIKQRQVGSCMLLPHIPHAHHGNATFLPFSASLSLTLHRSLRSQCQKASVTAAPAISLVVDISKEGNQSEEAKKTPGRPRKKVTNKALETPKKTSDGLNADASVEAKRDADEDEAEEYELLPLVCCFGHAMYEFIPGVKRSSKQMHPDKYLQWKGLQWKPPDFARAPGTVPSNVAVALSRLGGRVAFIGKVGDDAFGQKLVHILNTNKVQTQGVQFDAGFSTGVSQMHLTHGNRQVHMSCIQGNAEDSLHHSELNIHILRETRLFHFTSISLTRDPVRASLLEAIKLAKSVNASIFFDVNLPLTMWRSTDETWKVIREAWEQSDIVEVTKYELEHLLGEEDLAFRTLYYREASQSDLELSSLKRRRFEYHYTLEEIAPIWHENIKILLVTDGTWRIHYYTPKFHGSVNGTEDVLVSAFSCDRTGSGDAIVAGILRKLALKPDLYNDEDKLKRALRFAISAGIIAQWTIGAVECFPTENATQNLLEQICIPAMACIPSGNLCPSRKDGLVVIPQMLLYCQAGTNRFLDVTFSRTRNDAWLPILNFEYTSQCLTG